MKKYYFTLIISLISLWSFGQAEWVSLTNKENTKVEKFKPELVQCDGSRVVVNFSIDGFYMVQTQTHKGTSHIPQLQGASRLLQESHPDLIKLTASVIIPDNAAVSVNVNESEYIEFTNIEIAPSKGNLYRNQNPDDIPFVYGESYQKNEFYPGKLADFDNPYIIRDIRGLAVHAYPLQYNPVTKVLRVYHTIVLEVAETEGEIINPLIQTKSINSTVTEFANVYESHFINYKSNLKQGAEEIGGGILVISYGEYMDAMTPYVEWKNQIGHPTEMFNIADIGSTPAVIKDFIADYLDNNPELAFLLFVGDAQHIPPFESGSGFSIAHSDNTYTYLIGQDHYPDIFAGRFSAESVADVETQVQRTLEYEQATNISDGWLHQALGVSRNEGAGQGHNGEADYQHMDLIRDKLLTYNYDEVYREYDGGVPGMTNTSAALISQRINDGVSMINYCNHGSETGWSVANYGASNVNSLTNVDKLPFIWAVACVNGHFVDMTCFAETWMRATHNGNPAGALVTMMSTINQSWTPPMDAQDEFNDIIIGTYENKILRTFGGIGMNGCYKMNDINGSAGHEMTDTWLIFGDPSVKIRTDNPLPLVINHDPEVLIFETEITVESDIIGAFISLTIDNEIIGTGVIDESGSVTITVEPLEDPEKVILVTATAYNRIPATGNIEIIEELLEIDMQALRVLHPVEYYPCTGNSVEPVIVVRNKGELTVNNFQIYWSLNQSESEMMEWEGELTSLTTDTITLPEFILEEGENVFMYYVVNPNDETDLDLSNDTIYRYFTVENLDLIADFSIEEYQHCNAPISVSFNNLSENATTYYWNFGDGEESQEINPVHDFTELGIYNVILTADAGACGVEYYETEVVIGAIPPVIENVLICEGESHEFTTDSDGQVFWYADEDLTDMIAEGETFTTPELTESTSYYVYSLVETIIFGAKEEQTADLDGGYFTGTNRHGLVINSTEAVLLKSVKVWSNEEKDRLIVIEDSEGNVLDQVTVNIPVGEHRIDLNLNIPAGTDMILYGPESPNLYREGESGSWWEPAPELPYPYTVGDFIEIVQSTAGGYETNYYYYFYEWEVEKLCQSPAIKVEANVWTEIPNAEFDYQYENLAVSFEANTNQDAVYHWDFGDGAESTEMNPTHTYEEPGDYTVLLIVTNMCFESDNEVSFTLLTINNDIFTNLSVYPNPANSGAKIKSDIIIRNIIITDISGRNVKSDMVNSDTYYLELETYESGVYIIRLFDNDDNEDMLKLIVE
jgi:PKD repeat protein